MAVNKIVYHNNTIIDLSQDTVSADNLIEGYTAHNAAGEPIVGTMKGTVKGSYSPVTAGVSKILFGDSVLLDLTEDTVVPEAMLEGVTAHNKAGEIIVGTFVAGVDVAAMAISYTGAYSDQLDVVMSGKTYRLLTLTGSGTLKIPEEVTADVWLCNGGNGGMGRGYYGGGGGYFLQSEGVLLALSTVCTIGAGAAGSSASVDFNGNAGGSTSMGGLKPEAQKSRTSSGAGASGGGKGGSNISAYTNAGCGLSTVPFGETSLFSKHSGGGGGGGYYNISSSEKVTSYTGGAGGNNGANGGARKTSTSTDPAGGSGGVKGGGKGGKGGSSAANGSNATFYGSGGGAGGYFNDATRSTTIKKNGGNGYQGVIYIRIPYEQ